MNELPLPADISGVVALALKEDIGTGDRTADLVPADKTANAAIFVRESAVLCGVAWFDEVYRQLDSEVRIDWHKHDGDSVAAGDKVCTLQGSARALLTGERTALNFLQTLSGTATVTRNYVDCIKETATQILDTRKTLPGLRSAQKYAILCGGGNNHRQGLFDAILIKENHILAAGSIADAVGVAKQQQVPVEVEVESLAELEEALATDTDSVLLDNFSRDDLRAAVELNNGQCKLEASGNITLETLPEIAATGVDYISIGGLTKNVRAIDFSMRIR